MFLLIVAFYFRGQTPPQVAGKNIGQISERQRTSEADSRTEVASKNYLGFDRNDYPSDAALAALRQSFSFSGYWLNPPPGETGNTWQGKRERIRAAGFGFLVLFNGRLDRELKKTDAASLGRGDGEEAIRAAKREGFPEGTAIFVDQEEGGRMLTEQKAYLYAWIDTRKRLGLSRGRLLLRSAFR